MEYTCYINGIQHGEQEFLQEMVDQEAILKDFADVNEGYTFIGDDGSMFWIEFMVD